MFAKRSCASFTCIRLPNSASASSKKSSTGARSQAAKTERRCFSVSPMYLLTTPARSTRYSSSAEGARQHLRGHRLAGAARAGEERGYTAAKRREAAKPPIVQHLATFACLRLELVEMGRKRRRHDEVVPRVGLRQRRQQVSWDIDQEPPADGVDRLLAGGDDLGDRLDLRRAERPFGDRFRRRTVPADRPEPEPVGPVDRGQRVGAPDDIAAGCSGSGSSVTRNVSGASRRTASRTCAGSLLGVAPRDERTGEARVARLAGGGCERIGCVGDGPRIDGDEAAAEPGCDPCGERRAARARGRDELDLERGALPAGTCLDESNDLVELMCVRARAGRQGQQLDRSRRPSSWSTTSGSAIQPVELDAVGDLGRPGERPADERRVVAEPRRDGTAPQSAASAGDGSSGIVSSCR